MRLDPRIAKKLKVKLPAHRPRKIRELAPRHQQRIAGDFEDRLPAPRKKRVAPATSADDVRIGYVGVIRRPRRLISGRYSHVEMRHDPGSTQRVSDEPPEDRRRGHVIVWRSRERHRQHIGLVRGIRGPVRCGIHSPHGVDFGEEIFLGNRRAHRLQLGI